MVQCKRIGHLTLETSDIGRLADYYESVVGLRAIERSANEAFLSTRVGQLAVHLCRGSIDRCTGVSFEIAPDSDLRNLSKGFAADGLRSELRSDSIPGVERSLCVADPIGLNVTLFSEWQSVAQAEPRGVAPLKLGHVAFVVRDPERIAQFYAKQFGFRVSDWVDRFFVFMRCGADHHTMNFLQGDGVRMHHHAFEMRDTAHLIESCETLGMNKIRIIWGPVRHGPGHNVATYHATPNNQVVELFSELDRMLDEELGYFDPRPWHEEFPLRPKVWQGDRRRDVWGPPIPTDFLNPKESLVR